MDSYIKKTSLLEYRNFLEHFVASPFQLTYKFIEVVTIEHLKIALTLESSYINSFYLFIVAKSFLINNCIDNKLLIILANKLFLNELCIDGDTLTPIHEILVSGTVEDIEKNIEALKIEKILRELTNIFKEKHIYAFNFTTNNIILNALLDFKHAPLFIESFLMKRVNIEKHNNIIYKVLYKHHNLGIAKYFDEEQDDDDLNDNLDFLEISLFIIWEYLQCIHLKNHYKDELSNKQPPAVINNLKAKGGVLKNDYKGQVVNKQESNLLTKTLCDNKDLSCSVKSNSPGISTNNESSSSAKVENHSPRNLSEEDYMKHVNVIFCNIYYKSLEDIKILPKDFNFITELYTQSFYLLTVSQTMERDLFIIFMCSFSIYVITLASSNPNTLLQTIERTMKCRDFIIPEAYMLELHKRIIQCLLIIKNKNISRRHLEIFLNVEGTIYLTPKNKTDLIDFYLRNEVLSQGEKLEITRRVFYTITTDYNAKSYENSRDKHPLQATCFFLEFISTFYTSAEFNEINHFFDNFINYEFSLEYYADFLTRNNFEIPLHVYLKNHNDEFICTFYILFFKKIRINFFRDRKILKEDSVDFDILIFKHVSNFCKYFLMKGDPELIPVLNAVPKLPLKRENFFIYFEMWKFILENDFEDDLLFFRYKTPALLNIASSFTNRIVIDEDLAVKIYTLLERNNDPIMFSYKNIYKNFNSILLVIIFYVEYEKIRNFNFTGIIEYINDISLLKYYYEELGYLLTAIHYKLDISCEAMIMYAKLLLTKFNESFESTKRLIKRILVYLVKNMPNIVYDIEINNLMNNIFVYYTGNNVSKTEDKIYMSLLKLYKNEFLNRMKINIPNTYAYLVLFNLDMSLFPEYSISGKDFYANAIKHYQQCFQLITNFGVLDKTNAYKPADYYIHECLELDDISWLVDVVYLKRGDRKIIRMTIDVLVAKLEKVYELSTLYYLLKIYNHLHIREDSYNLFLHKSLTLGLDLSVNESSIRNLVDESTGFFNFYFASYYYLLTLDKKYSINTAFPTDPNLFSMFTINELCIIHNMFKNPITAKILKRNGALSFNGYFYDRDNLSMYDVISILRNSRDKEFVTHAIQSMAVDNIMFFIPALVQCLKREAVFTDVFINLLEHCKNKYNCHFLLWSLRGNLYGDCDIFKRCINDIETTYGGRKSTGFMNELVFFDQVTNISSEMSVFINTTRDVKSKKINESLKRIIVPQNVYLPTDITYIILKAVDNSGRALQSHAKIPFLASFYCIKEEFYNHELHNIDYDNYKDFGIEKKCLIFKAGDDCRQDMLAIQLITLFKDIFEKCKLDIFLHPYQVIATGPGTGIIELVPDAITRHEMGSEKINNIVHYFEINYGFKYSPEYKKALRNFLVSLAGYSLVTYFLNIKDRHNANIMLDKHGHIIHIDFGFMLENSPGYINIELSVKLTTEIYDLLNQSGCFDEYLELTVQGFYALRRNSKDIIFLVDCFKDCGLPCFSRATALDNLIDRFKFNLNDEEARTFMISTLLGSVGKMRTWMYDKIQELTNNIAF